MEAVQLQAQLLKARDSVCEVGSMKFTVRRPTEMELVRMRNQGGQVEINLHAIQNAVVDWEVLESDIVHGGASDRVPFNKALYSVWVEDRVDVWSPIAKHIEKLIDEHQKKIALLTGN
jgi:hypothetical protein